MDSIRQRFEALDPSDQQKILDKHRYAYVEDDWWYESIFDDLVVDVNQYGYLVDEHRGRGTRTNHCIWFSGFYSQGDGASFDGRIWNWTVALQDFPVLAQYLKDGSVDHGLSWSSTSRYSHSRSLSFSEHIDLGNPYDQTTDRIRFLAHEVLSRDAEEEWEKFVAHTEKQVQKLCDELFERLRTEYEYLTEDEQVLESLLSNDMLEDELEEYEDGEGEEPEGIGRIDSSTDHAAA